MRLLAAACIALGLAPTLGAADAHASNSRQIDAPLRFEVAHQSDPELRERFAHWLESSEGLSTDANGRGSWIITDGEVVLVNGSAYRQAVGEHPWVVVSPDGQWAAGGSHGVLANGNYFPGQMTDAMRIQLQNALSPQQFALIPQPVRSEPAAASAVANPSPAPSVSSVPATRAPDERADVSSIDVPVVVDHTPPQVDSAELILFPDDPARRRVVPLGQPGVFVGAQSVTLRVTMNEKMGSPPKVRVQQPNFNPVELPLLNAAANPVFEYSFFPVTSAANNGPVKIEILGKKDGTLPEFGFDEAGNPIQAGSPNTVFDKGLLVDTVPPGLRRVDLSQPGNFRTQPRENAVLPKNGFPKEIFVLVQDYNQPDNGTFDGANIASDLASGVDFDQAGLPGSPVQVKLFDPKGKEIKGVVVAATPSGLRLLLPDVYDVSAGVFPDTDGDGVADPIEGSYRIQVDLIDRAGNVASQTVPFGEDTTPLKSSSLAVSIRPVFTTPFPNPNNPIGEKGTFVKKLDSVEVTSDDPMWDPVRSNAELMRLRLGPGSVPEALKVTVTRTGKTITLTVDPDQDGDGKPDWENPPPGVFLPPGTIDPRFGKNDGEYIVRVHARDTAGNESTIEREILLDTTEPKSTTTFPTNTAVLGPDVRIVDATLTDPVAASGRNGSGVQLDFSQINLRFLGNTSTPPQFIRGVVFVHKPNDSDPTLPDFNPNDHFPKILYQITDTHGDSTPLPKNGKFDGVYEMKVVVRDRAGNEATGITSFTYSSRTTSTTGTTSVVDIHRLVRLRAPIRQF